MTIIQEGLGIFILIMFLKCLHIFCISFISYLCFANTCKAQVGRKTQTISQSTYSTQAKADSLSSVAEHLAYTNPDTAIGISSLAKAISEEIDYPEGLLKAYMALAISYSNRGNSEKALQSYIRALQIAKQQQFNNVQEILYGNIANIYQAQDDYETSLQYYFLAIDALKRNFRFNKLHDIAYAIAIHYNNMAFVMQKLYYYERAMSYARQALNIACHGGYRELVPYILYTKADVLVAMDRPEEAEKICSRLKNAGTKDIRNSIAMLSGDISLKKGDAVQALQYYRRADDSLHEGAIERIQALCSLSKCYYYLGLPDTAAGIALKVMDMAGSYHARRALTEMSGILSSIYLSKGDYQKASRLTAQYAPLKDSLNNLDKNRLIYSLEMKYRAAEKDKKIAQNKLQIVQQHTDIVRRNFWILFLAAGALLVIVFLSVYHLQQRRLYRQQITSIRQQEKINSLLAMSRGEEKERKRMARELHDGIGGLLSSLKMFLMNIGKHHPGLQQNETFGEALLLADQTLIEVRKTAHNLMPELLLQYGLPEAVRIFCQSIQRLNEITIDFQYYGFIDRLNTHFELFIYRIIQELIQNVIKHAQAKNLLIQLSLHGQVMGITVEDNGIGMTDGTTAHEGKGLSSIVRRIQELNGTINIDTTPGKGTSVFIEFDMQAQELFRREEQKTMI